jgi:hypothetical protein
MQRQVLELGAALVSGMSESLGDDVFALIGP